MKDYATSPLSSTPIAAGAQPFILSGGPIGILVIHGYGGSAGDYRIFAEGLNQRGYTVMVMRVAGHGQGLTTLRSSHIYDWRKSVADAMAELRAITQSIVVLGASFGGALALDAVANVPGNILGYVSVNTPTSYRGGGGTQKILLRVLRIFTPYYPKFGLSRKDKEKYKQLGSTTAWPIDGILETYSFFSRYLFPVIGRVHVPALLLANEHDPIVGGESLQKLYSSLGSMVKTKMFIPGKTHRPFRDPEATAFLVDQVDHFIQRIVQSA